MKKQILVLLLLMICAVANAQQAAQHVILVSIDGFRPDFYMEAKWPAPNLKWMAENGTKAEGVRGVYPSVTYPSHTTLITGAKPARHGIYYNSPFEEKGQTGAWYWYENEIKVPTLWDAVRAKGMKSAAFIWPVSVDAPIDYNIPEFWYLKEGTDRIEPMRDKDVPNGFFEELETEVLGKMNNNTFNGEFFNREDRTGEMAAYVLEKYKPNFIALHLIGTDHFQHQGGRDGEMVPFAVAAADRAIGKIKEAAERAGILENTTFIISGDHGFVDVHSLLSPNVWLANAGLMSTAQDRGNWKAAFHTSGAAAFLMLKDPKDIKTLTQVKQILNDLPEKTKKLFRVVSKEELAQVGADPNAFLAIAPIPGVAMSGSASGDDLKRGSGGTHGYFPDFKQIETGFVAWGAGVTKGKLVHKIGLEDVAPIIAALLGLDFTAADGVLFPGILKR
ncbi:MAG: AP endonuclease [Cytophagales bacterium CG17_big_fil_post_rev_8_21_14_2_50_40_13]|nr:MAG: AP endonuclease [Cytophagales bacterium CG17_big_fil_post_rev_8_21_14_2_50_40_13]